MGIFKAERLKQADLLENNDPARKIVMVVDDEDANRAVMVSILKPFYRLLEARDGREALSIVEGLHEPQSLACIVSDQRMPHLTGVELLERTHKLVPRTI